MCIINKTSSDVDDVEMIATILAIRHVLKIIRKKKKAKRKMNIKIINLKVNVITVVRRSI